MRLPWSRTGASPGVYPGKAADSAGFIFLVAFIYRLVAAALLQSSEYSLAYSLYGVLTGSLGCALMYYLLGYFLDGFGRFNAALLFAITPTWIFWGLASFEGASQFWLLIASVLCLLHATERRSLLAAVGSAIGAIVLVYLDVSFTVLIIVSAVYLFIRGEFRLLLVYVAPFLQAYLVMMWLSSMIGGSNFLHEALLRLGLLNNAFEHYAVLRSELSELHNSSERALDFTFPGFWKESRTLAGWIIFGTEFNWLARSLFEPVMLFYIAGLIGIQRSVRRNPSFGFLSLLGLVGAIVLFFQISWSWSVRDHDLLILVIPTYILVALGIENISGLRSTQTPSAGPVTNGSTAAGLGNGPALLSSAEASSARNRKASHRRKRRILRLKATQFFLLLIVIAMSVKLFKPREDFYVPDIAPGYESPHDTRTERAVRQSR
ncbi:hypothetical protein [Allohahella marinimesophila]|uniref:Glycosyltransferase RgtA/B/C/D-like domain-containing protein n=1 Tax=Allohahella marinimesophila TaxID=1054972 RepID=A0ABP7PKF6_9GAMM